VPKHALITVDPDLPFGQEVIEGSHQDAGLDGRPYLALTAPDGRVLKADESDGTLAWNPAGSAPGAWERFIAVPGAYVIFRDHYVGLIPRGGPWEQT